MCQDETIPNLQARITQITRIYILVLYPRKYKLSAKFAKLAPKYIFRLSTTSLAIFLPFEEAEGGTAFLRNNSLQRNGVFILSFVGIGLFDKTGNLYLCPKNKETTCYPITNLERRG